MAIGGISGLCKKLRRSRSGAAAVEFALLMFFIVLPLFFALFEMSRALHHHNIVLKSVRDAARYAARIQDCTPGPCVEFQDCSGDPTKCIANPSCTDSANEAGTIKNLAMYGNVTTTGLPPLLPLWTDVATVCIVGPLPRTVTIAGGTITPLFVRVSVSVPYQDLGLLQLFGVQNFNLTAQHEEPYIGQ